MEKERLFAKIYWFQNLRAFETQKMMINARSSSHLLYSMFLFLTSLLIISQYKEMASWSVSLQICSAIFIVMLLIGSVIHAIGFYKRHKEMENLEESIDEFKDSYAEEFNFNLFEKKS